MACRRGSRRYERSRPHPPTPSPDFAGEGEQSNRRRATVGSLGWVPSVAVGVQWVCAGKRKMSDEVRVPATASPPRDEAIRVGDVAPDFRLPAVNDGGEPYEFAMSEVLAKSPVLLVFYQDDGMPTCTRQLNIFAQEHETLVEAGVRVVGMNTNGIGSHAKFHERDHFPFPLVSDFFGDVTKAYGLWDADERKSRRALVLVGEDGLVRHVEPHFSPGNMNAVLELFEALGMA